MDVEQQESRQRPSHPTLRGFFLMAVLFFMIVALAYLSASS